MPQFQLNKAYVELSPHPYNRLDDFAKGYVEAMFFTNGDTGDKRENLLNDLGVQKLTAAAVRDIAASCKAFQDANRADLDAAKELVPGSSDLQYASEALDDTRCGHLFWYARQGHGVGWTDDGYADVLTRLQDASRKAGEAEVYVKRGGWIEHVG